MVAKKNGAEPPTVVINGVTYAFRKVKVKEADAAYDAAVIPGTDEERINSRLQSRMLLTYSMEPTISLDDIEDWDNVDLGFALRAYNQLNTPQAGPKAPSEDADSAA